MKIKCTIANILLLASANVFASSSTFYEHDNFSGFEFVPTISVSTAVVSNTATSVPRFIYSYLNGSLDESWNDDLSSLKVADGECVVLFEHRGFQGTAKYFGPGEYNSLSAYNFNDKASSMHIIDSAICNDSILSTIYKHANFSGANIKVPVGYKAAELSAHLLWHNFNDEFSSAKPGVNACIKLYKDGSYQGSGLNVSDDLARFSDYSFNDKGSSLEILPANACAYNTGTFGGSGGTGGGGSGGGSGGPFERF